MGSSAAPTLGEKAFKLQVRSFARVSNYIADSKKLSFGLIILGAVISAALISGVLFIEESNNASDLYTHEGSRLHSEQNILRDTFGLSRLEAAIFRSSTGNVATETGFDSMVHTLLPLLREDETAACLDLDGDASSVPALCDDLPYATDNIYCACNLTAANPDQVSISWPGSAQDVELTLKDVCERPEVPAALAPSEIATYRAAEPLAQEQPVYLAVLNAHLNTADLSFGANSVYTAARPTMPGQCANIMQAAELARGRSDLVTSAILCNANLTIEIGIIASQIFNSNLRTDGLTTMWGVYLQNPAADEPTLEAAYIAGVGSDDGRSNSAYMSTVTHGATVLAIAEAFSAAVLDSFLSIQYIFLQQGNVISHGYQATAACISEFTAANRAAVLSAVFDSQISARASTQAFLSSGNEYNVTTFNDTAIAAIQAYLTSELSSGGDIANNVTIQGNALSLYLSTTTEPGSTIVAVEAAKLPDSFSETGLAAALATAVGIGAMGGNVASNSSHATISNAYVSNGGAIDVIGNVLDMTDLAAPIQVQLASDAVTAAIEGVLASVIAPSLVFDGKESVEGALRPLPRKWGFDRFPCSRLTPVDIFSEGNFDLPLNMKFLESVSVQVAAFLTQPFFSQYAEISQCSQRNILDPVKEAVYFSGLPDPATYQTPNFDAFAAAEETYLAAVEGGMSTTDAASAAVVTFISEGGMAYSSSAPTTPVVISVGDYPLYAAVIAEAAATGDVVEENFLSNVEAFAAFGFHHHPQYAGKTDEILVNLTNSAIRNTNNDAVSVEDCVRGNVENCFLSWAASKQAPSLVFGDVSPTAIGSARFVLNNWNEHTPLFKTRIEAQLGRDTTTAELADIQDSFEAAMIAYFEPIFNAESGTGFDSGEPFSSESFLYTTERSVSDVVNEAGETNHELIAAATVILIVYVAFTAYNLWSSIFSHSLLAVWGLVTIVASVLAALGLSAYAGISFTPIATAVVPFLAIGIGIDDMFVILRAYARVIREREKPDGVLGRVMGEVGPSVTFTSLTNLIAFLIAAVAPITIVRTFALQMAISVFLNWILLMLLFVPAVFLDAKRVFASRADGFMLCCHDPNRARAPSFFETFFEDTYSNIILSTPGRIIIIVLFALWFGIAFWQGFFLTPTGLRLSSVANEGSAVYEFAVQVESDYLTYNAQLLTQSDDFPAAQQNILLTLSELSMADNVVTVPSVTETYWLTSLLAFNDPLAPTTPIATASFYPVLASWLSSTGATFLADLRCKDSTTGESAPCEDIIGAFDTPQRVGSNANIVLDVVRGAFYVMDQDTTDDFVSTIESTRARVDAAAAQHNNPSDPNYRSFVIGYTYIFWDQYIHTDFDLYFVVGLCLLGVLLATFFNLFNLTTTLLIGSFILMIVIEVYGLMNAWGVEKNAFSMVNLCLAIGMGVEFTAHIAHEFLGQEAPERLSRVRQTLAAMGAAMFHGAASSILTTLFIAGSETGFIREYYFGMFFATIVVAFVNGMVLLPVVLSLIGPAPISVADDYLDDEADKGHEDGAYDFDDMTAHARSTMTPMKPTSAWGDVMDSSVVGSRRVSQQANERASSRRASSRSNAHVNAS